MILAGLASIIMLSVIVLHSQTDVLHHISSYITDKQLAQFYPPSYAVVNTTESSTRSSPKSTIQEQRYQMKNASLGVQQIPRVTPYVDGVRESFVLVQGVSSRLYVYSALWDVQYVKLEVIMVQGYKFTNLLCVLYYTEDTSKPGVYVKPVIKELHTNKSPYTCAVIKCPIKSDGNKDKVPTFVGVVEKELAIPKQTFTVENVHGVKHDFTVCVPALHGMKNTALLVQHIEMVRLFGARRIIFYNHSISSDVDAALRMYAREFKEGREKLEVLTLPWKVPVENGQPLKLHYYAQQLCIDECHYRYKRLSKYMVFNDLDEFLVPIQDGTWAALIAQRLRIKPRSKVWLFRNTVLNTDRPSPAPGFEQDYLRYGSSILGLTSRDQHVYPIHVREKSIIDPMTIEEKGIHWVWDSRNLTDVLPVEEGILFHYRSPLNKCTPQVKETRVVDRYGKQLVAGLKQAWDKLHGVGLGWSPFVAADKSECALPKVKVVNG